MQGETEERESFADCFANGWKLLSVAIPGRICYNTQVCATVHQKELYFHMRIHSTIRTLLLGICLSAAVMVGLTPRANAASSLSVSDKMVDVLKTVEGFAAKPYWDYSQYTVGYGTKCPDDKLAYYQQNGITKAEAEKLLQKELDGFETSVNGFATKHGLTLKQQQFDALVSFTYNCGASWMDDTNGYFNTAIREGETGSRLVYGFCLYSMAGNQYILQERRLCEANMYLNGVYKAYNASGYTPPEDCKYVFLDGNGGKVRFAICGYDADEATPVSVSFTKIPTGVDSKGKHFVYTLAGWYTAAGKKVEKLDKSLTNGQTLYAKWKDPDGNIKDISQSETVDNLKITVTGTEVNIRSGPGTDYSKVGVAYKGDTFTVTQVQQTSTYTWGKTEKGWICLDYTNYESLLTPEKSFPWYGTVNSAAVNYRAGAGLSYSVVGQKNKGDAVTITEEKTASSLQWGKMSDGNWICLDYVDYNENQSGPVKEVKLLKAPDKTQYDSMSESLKLEGSVLQITYSDGSLAAMSLTRDMVTSYQKTGTSVATVKASYQGKSVSFQVYVGRYSVKFLNWDGSVLSETQYGAGETVKEPATPSRPSDKTWSYRFAGWDKPVAVCTADAVYTALYNAQYIDYTVVFKNADGTVISTATYHYGDTVQQPETPKRPENVSPEAIFRGWTPQVTKCTGDAVYTAIFADAVVKGDYNWDLIVTDADAIYLLRHTLFPQQYPVFQTGDINLDGITSDADAIYLLRHTLFPESYPLK